MLHAIRVSILSLVTLASLYACGGQSSGGSTGGSAANITPTVTSSNPNVISGANFYRETALGCVGCHGADGSGGTAPQPINVAAPDPFGCASCTDVASLASVIASTMPQGNVGACPDLSAGSCAYDIAEYMMEQWIIPNTPAAPTPGISVTASANPTTDESGATTTIMLRLDSEPAFDVTINVVSSNTNEGTVSLPSLTFTSADWNINKSIIVTGVDDGNVDGNVTYSIMMGPAVSADPDYSNRSIADVTVTNNDNDVAAVAGITVTPINGLITDEGGLTATFQVSLDSMPTDDVTIGLESSNTNEGTVAPASLTFTSLNYNIPQTVTITGVDDVNLDGAVNYMITTNPAASADPEYNLRDASDVSVVNNDNEIPPPTGITVAPVNGLITTEAGASATFTVVLQSMPSADVTVPLSSSNTAEGTVAPALLTFTTANWNIQQTVTVTGQDDALDDNDVQYTIVTGDPSSLDAGYDALTANDVADVTVTNTDDDLSQLEIGQQLYRQVFNMNDGTVTESCETCHGSAGLGNDAGQAVFGDLLTSTPIAPGSCGARCDSQTAFRDYTLTNMPVSTLSSGFTALIGIGSGEDPAVVCDQTCADAIAAYVFNNFSTVP